MKVLRKFPLITTKSKAVPLGGKSKAVPLGAYFDLSNFPKDWAACATPL